MTLAVVFVAHAAGTWLPWGWVISALSVVLFAIGLQYSPLAAWRRRVLAACLVLIYVGIAWPVVAQLVCGACIGCDPWWLEWFWICI